jgi:hypothetical protein
MRDITVRKADLIATLKTNRDNHLAEYEIAVEVYKDRFVKAAQAYARDAVRRARIGEQFIGAVWLPVPEEHTEDYDRAIAMLEWEIEDDIRLNEHDFATFVLNQWGWAKSYATSTQSYTRS